MRIGISTSVVQRGKSGVGQYVLALVRALTVTRSEHEFTLFVLEEDVPLFEFARDAVRIVTVPEAHRPPTKNIWWHQRALPRLVSQLGIEVLHVPSYRRMLWPRPCTLVATIHDLAPFRLPGKYDLLRMFYGRTVVRRLAHRQNHIIAVSQQTADDIDRFFGIPKSCVTVVHNGLDHARFTPDGRRAAAELLAQRHDVRPPFFLYVARLEHPAKNHARLIEAFTQFKTRWPSPWQLVLCGSDWHGAEVIHDLARRSPFAADIRLPGFVPPGDLPTWYRGATAMVYPSLFEGFGLPLLEAMACGCPVLASSIGAVHEVSAGAALTANPRDVDDLTRQLLRLAQDDDLRDKLRTAGLQRAREFDWQRTATATLGIYEHAARHRLLPATASTPAATLARAQSCIMPAHLAKPRSASATRIADLHGR